MAARTRQCVRIVRMFLLPVVAVSLLLTGCINPVSPTDMSDWRWRQWNPDYRSPYPSER